MFNFRIIDMADGNQIIDTSLRTPYDALTPTQMVEYTEMDKRMEFMNRMQRKEQTERKRKSNPLYKVACLVGLV